MSVTILAINDFHAKHDPEVFVESGKRVYYGGARRLAQCLYHEREKAPSNSMVLCVSVGDMFLGSDYFTYFNGEVSMKILDLLQFNVLAVGNHDFDQGGRDNLLKQAKYAPNLEIICANVFFESNKLAFSPYKVYEENGVKVAIVGLLGEDAWDAIPLHSKKGLVLLDMFEAAANCCKEIKSTHQDINLWVCLSHTGINRGDQELALSGLFDVVLSGHEHFNAKMDWVEVNPTAYRSKCYLHPGNCEGRAVSKISFENGLIQSKETIILDETFEHDLAREAIEVNKLLLGYKTKIDDLAGEVIGHCHAEHYSKNHLDANFCPHTMVPISDIVLDAFFHVVLRNNTLTELSVPHCNVFAVYNFGSIRGEIPKGPVQIRHVCNTLPFNGKIELLKIEGKVIHSMLARNVLRAENAKIGKAPGMGYHFKWLSEHRTASTIDTEEHFYLVTTRYIRENDLFELFREEDTELHPTLEDRVVWQTNSSGREKITGIRDSLVDLIRTRKAIH